MTECERIIRKGIISPDFLQQEIRNGFLVDTNRKKLWMVILDLLLEFDAFCKGHSLTYYLTYGSMLGAVRHKGFIPWDDDIDLVMPRVDYEKFLEHGHELNKEPYYFQVPGQDGDYFYTFAKIRNTNTTGIVEMFKYARFNHGIWLSVFPLDEWDLNGGEGKYARIKTLTMELSTYMRKDNPNLSEKDKIRVANYCGRNPYDIYNEIDKLAKSGNGVKTDYCAIAIITQGKYNEKLLLKEDFKAAVPCQVEGFDIPIPSGYDHLLSTWYGDYMQLPPIEHRGDWHSGTIFDADKPYVDYLGDGKSL